MSAERRGVQGHRNARAEDGSGGAALPVLPDAAEFPALDLPVRPVYSSMEATAVQDVSEGQGYAQLGSPGDAAALTALARKLG